MILLDIASPARIDAIAALRSTLVSALDDVRIDPRSVNDLVTAATEMMTNAVEHANPPAAMIGLRMEADHDALILSVTDDGGVFDGFTALAPVPGNPLDNALVEGGLGLFIVRRLFPDNGYEPGGGDVPNRFWVRHALRRARRTVLVLEDDPTLRHLIEVYLVPVYEVISCDSVTEAKFMAGRRQPDLILADINLPDATAFDLIRHLGSEDCRAPAPVVLMTAERSDDIREAAINLGVDDFVPKPFGRAALVETVRRALNRADRERAQMIRHLGSEMTAALAPSLPARIGSYHCAVRTLPATSGGGDLVFTMPSDDSLVVVADVMGHGPAAKTLAHAYAGCFYGLAAKTDRDWPGGLLGALSNAVAEGVLFERSIMTALLLRLGADGLIRMASAGHPPPLLAASGRVVSVPVEGPLIGLLRNPVHPETVAELAPGDRLFVYTDGLLVDRAAGISVADVHPAVLSELRSTAALPIEVAADHILTAVKSTFGMEPRDDITFVLIERAAA